MVDPIDAPSVDVFSDVIDVDGQHVGSTTAIARGGEVVEVRELVAMLAAKKRRAAELGRADASEVLLAIDADTPAVVAKSIVFSAARAGFPHVGFLVKSPR